MTSLHHFTKSTEKKRKAYGTNKLSSRFHLCSKGYLCGDGISRALFRQKNYFRNVSVSVNGWRFHIRFRTHCITHDSFLLARVFAISIPVSVQMESGPVLGLDLPSHSPSATLNGNTFIFCRLFSDYPELQRNVMVWGGRCRRLSAALSDNGEIAAISVQQSGLLQQAKTSTSDKMMITS